MYLLSEDKQVLMEFERIDISKNLTAKKDEKYVLVATGRTPVNQKVIAAYPDEESAKNAIIDIMIALNQGRAVYEL
ncbi:MAG: hypothetical protein HFE63_06120 [Clostridiales bacterium]|nr:hypothetical protein [Clostridiales bacterium]